LAWHPGLPAPKRTLVKENKKTVVAPANPLVPLHGLGRQQSYSPTAFPSWWQSGTNFARIRGAGRITFPKIPVSRFVVDIELTFPVASDGRVEFHVEDPPYGTCLSLGRLWDQDKERSTIPCRLFRQQPFGVNWGGEHQFPAGERLRLSLVGIDAEKALLLDGKPVLRASSAPVDLILSIVASGSPACIIHGVSIRDLTDRDSAFLGKRVIGPYQVTSDSRAEARVRDQTAGLADHPIPEKAFILPTLNAAMRWAPADEFVMGGDVKYESWGKGKHRVKLTHGYWIAQFETTQEQWQKLCSENPSRFKGSPYLPVNGINWEDAKGFCNKLDAAEHAQGRVPAGYQYRLPTEAEWEYAARAGESSLSPPVPSKVWFGPSSGGRLHEVGELPPNRWGLYDMLGNVDEWCLDVWRPYPQGDSAVLEDPFAPRRNSDEWLNVRGGAWWMGDPNEVTPIARDRSPSAASAYCGFRFVLGPMMPSSPRTPATEPDPMKSGI